MNIDPAGLKQATLAYITSRYMSSYEQAAKMVILGYFKGVEEKQEQECEDPNAKYCPCCDRIVEEKDMSNKTFVNGKGKEFVLCLKCMENGGKRY